ncbi:MAG: APC family permease, partial [Sporichthyaceae bacterium]|nr:APC family permease [Sporichthyaceae bacterium]
GIFLVIELGALAVLVVLGLLHLNQPVSVLWRATTIGSDGVLASASAGLIVSYTATALFAYNGYGTAVYYAEETRQATATIGRAILWSLGITVAAEFLPLVAVLLGTPSMNDLIGAADPMSYFLLARGGTVVNDLVSIAIAIAVINAVLAIVLQIGRLLYASARDRSWPDWIGRPLGGVHPRLRTPVVATLLVGIVGALLLRLVPFNILLILTGSNLLVTYLLVALAALVGRMKDRTSHAPYKLPWWPFVPAVMILATIVVAYENLKADWVPVVVTLAIFAVGFPYYALYLHPRRSDRWTLPDPAGEELP